MPSGPSEEWYFFLQFNPASSCCLDLWVMHEQHLHRVRISHATTKGTLLSARSTIIFRPWDESESEVEEKSMMEPKNTTSPIYLKHQGA